MQEKKILIIIDQLEVGGAGRVTSTLLSGLIEKGYEVVMALDNVNAKTFYPIPKEVKQVYVPIKGNMPSGLKQVKLILTIRNIIKREGPEVIIAITFFPFFYTHYAALGTRIPVICYDHTSFGRDMGRFVNWIRYSLYGKADKLIILTEKDKRLLGDKFPRKEVVYNPLTYPIVKHNGERRKTVLCVGRIDSWDVKGFDRIIKIWSNLAKKFPDWMLQIAGSGTTQKEMEVLQMVKSAGIEKSVELLGQISDMMTLYSHTSIFALPSRIEGFPMVLLEAMSQGCVCCAFELEGAVSEMMNLTSGAIVKDGDIDMFEKELEKLMLQYPHYSDLQESGYRDAERFTSERFYNQWDKILKNTI